jgi:SAM-dependent methyltransferase
MSTDEGSRNLAAAYEGLEDPDSFSDRGTLEAYRQSLLDRTRAQADFLAPHLGARARVVEIGSGNGRLLVELARRGSLGLGLGLDLAESRIAFARAWAEEEGLEHLRFEAADVFEVPLQAGSFSAAICITGTFGYFDAFEAGSAARVAQHLHEALEPAGTLWLELYPHPEYLRLLDAGGGEVRIWTELPAQDPWRYYLSRLELDDDREILTHTKTFVHRTSGEIDQGRREQLYLYTPDSIDAILRSAGFKKVRLYEGWSADSYRGGEVMVVAAQRAVLGSPDPGLS